MTARRYRKACGLILASALAMLLALPSKAQVLLRDAELERALKEIAAPVINAAGLSPNGMRILVLKDSSLNAFVLDGFTIVIHSGLLLKLDKPEMLQGVIAHEVGHIANGHLTRRPENLRNARTAAILGLAVATAVATVEPSAGAGIAIGTQSSAMRVFLGHTRAEEAAADQSGLRYMARAGIDPNGMVETLDIFRGQEALSSARQDPYLLSHPLTQDRLRAARGYAAAYGKNVSGTDANSAYWYDRAVAKLSAYLRNPGWTLRRVEESDTSDAALVAKAVAYHQAHNLQPALANVDALIAKRPDDAYAYETKGWILLESRQFAAAADAYAKAASLAPNQPLILAGYGRALLAVDTKASNAKALQVLEASRARDDLNPNMLRDLGQAYARNDQPGMAAVTSAERLALSGRLKDAAIHAKRAMGLLPRGSTGWRRAEDIVLAAESQEKRKTR